MEKSKISKFIGRYNLNSLIESVKWVTDGNVLKTSFISDDKSLLGSVSMKDFQVEDSEFGVYDTTKLVKMISVLEDDVEFSVVNIGGKGVSLKFNDKSTAVNYMLADLSVIPSVPDLKKLPNFNVQVKLDSAFINKFIRAKSALADESNFTFISKGGKSQIVLGYSSINTNRINIDVDSEVDGDVDAISFSATYLKEILVSNRDATEAILQISSDGLAHISFEVDNYTSQYYLVQIQ
jgi:hypothetical protein